MDITRVKEKITYVSQIMQQIYLKTFLLQNDGLVILVAGKYFLWGKEEVY